MVAARLLPADAKDRQRIDRYELVGEIASGGMATVYLARRAGVGGFQRFVAVKRLHPHLAHESEFVQMFLDEARLAALIHHPNVVSITEVGASDRGFYLVMDYIEGDTLARLMTDCAEAGRVVPTPVGLRIVIDMLTGLHAAHELHDEQGHPTGLVHRDVSPQNVLVGLDGISRISDFGVARAATRLAGTRVGQLKGKIAYMAPEQAAGDENLDRRADVFAAGVLLWELLTGRRLFRASNDAATLSRVVSEKIDTPLRYVEGLDPRISDVCMLALERPLSRRIPSAAAFAEMLETAAVRAGVLGSGKDVAAYMQSVLGEEVARQREAVRHWLSETDANDESTNAGPLRRNSVNPPRSEHPNANGEWSQGARAGERSSSASRSRPILGRDIHDSDPHDLTIVAPRPRWRKFTLAALCLGLIVSGTWVIARGQTPSVTAAPLTPIAAPGHWVKQVRAAEQQTTALGRMPLQSEIGSLRMSFDGLDHGAPQGAAARVGRVPPIASTRVPNVIPDVDLSNPYR